MRIYLFLFLFLFGLLSACCDDDDIIPNDNPCTWEPDPGPCDAAIPRYYFDPQSQSCKQFIWGGCDGVVPFETLEACEACLEE